MNTLPKIELQTIINLVKSTKHLILGQDVESNYDEKGLADYVTKVDISVQAYLQKELKILYPEIQFMGEEKDNNELDLSKPTWILDPIDGTTNLIHKYQMSAVSLGLMINKKPYLGVVYNPFTNEIFYAEKNKGAFLNNTKIQSSKVNSLSDCLVSIGTSPYEKYRADENFELFKKIFLTAQDIRRSGSAALDLCYVAAGRLGAYLERGLKPWDYAAGVLIIEEAGGKVTDFSGKQINFGEYSDILSSNQFVHDNMIELIK
ncbi:MAG: inositol monophosphatase family protein [Candidatus Gastranaerophilales bacterium]|nr:inositol monophosphatase family protein [Candidatus Gastranaerophilales bacterium]